MSPKALVSRPGGRISEFGSECDSEIGKPRGESQLRVMPSERALTKDTDGGAAASPHDGAVLPVFGGIELVGFALTSLLIISVVAILYAAKAFFLPVVAAFVVGTMLSPAANFLERHRIPRALSSVLIVSGVGAGVTLAVGLISSPVMEWTGRLPELGALLREKLHLLDRPIALWRELANMLGASDTLSATPFQMPKLEWVKPALEFLPPTFTEFLLFVATLILFIASWRDLRRALVMTFTGHDSRLRALRVLNDIEDHLGAYLLTVTLINVGVGVATGLICWATGMPNPAGLGALAAALNYLPIIGPVAMFAVLTVVSVITFPTIGAALIAPLAFVGVTFLEGHFVTPTIIGRRLELNALAVFLSLAFWTWLWGPMGGFLSSPLLIVLLILRDHSSQSR
jgi:predicted PurR-regulated permease PerM